LPNSFVRNLKSHFFAFLTTFIAATVTVEKYGLRNMAAFRYPEPVNPESVSVTVVFMIYLSGSDHSMRSFRTPPAQ
jgi:hypothetical protein